MRRVVILLGPPGAGKGTQATRLSAALSLPHVATGDLFRENLAKGTDLGERAKKFMDAGQLVPDDVVLEMLFERVAKKDASLGYLLDGFPRTLAQAEALEKRLDKGTRVQVLNLMVPDAVLLERITGRRTCTKCGRVFHVKHAPPKVADKCDVCAGALVQRSDDTEAVFGKRLSVYREQTQPLEGFYQKRGLVQNVDGNRSPDDVFKDLKRSASGGEAA
jgi:adenylate kinase